MTTTRCGTQEEIISALEETENKLGTVLEKAAEAIDLLARTNNTEGETVEDLFQGVTTEFLATVQSIHQDLMKQSMHIGNHRRNQNSSYGAVKDAEILASKMAHITHSITNKILK